MARKVWKRRVVKPDGGEEGRDRVEVLGPRGFRLQGNNNKKKQIKRGG